MKLPVDTPPTTLTVIVNDPGAVNGLAVKVPVAKPVPDVRVQDGGVPTTGGAPVLVIVHKPGGAVGASLGKPLTVTTTLVLARAMEGVMVMNGSMISVAVPLSPPQVTVRV